MAHTPGPWRVSGGRPRDGYFLVDRFGHNLLYGLPEAEANAHAMAAAPELLAALKKARRVIEMNGLDPVDHNYASILEQAERAIAKAEGGS